LILLYFSTVLLSLQVTPDSATVGDTLTLNIKGALTDSVSVIMPDSFPDLVILDSLTRTSDTTGVIKFVSFSTGYQEFKLKEGSDTLSSGYFIKSVLEPENKGLSPIWGPYGFFNWHYLLYLLIIPLAFLAYLVLKRLKKDKTQLIETEEMAPAEEALKNLKILEEKASEWNWNKLYTSLSYISRRYMERKTKIPAVEATTSELLPLIKKEGLTLLFPLSRQFPEWDLIKFADEKSTKQEFEKELSLVRSVIEQMEKEEEEEEEEDDSLQ
jgi:hypothetical protein